MELKVSFCYSTDRKQDAKVENIGTTKESKEKKILSSGN